MKNMKYIVLIFIFIIGCVNKPQNQDPIPNHESFKIESEQVGETRTINVWTPPEYKESTET